MASILLIENDKILAQNTEQILKSHGHAVDWQVNGQEAVISADLNRPNLVIIDLQLSLHSGIEFLYEFRSYVDWQNIPVIVVSDIPPEDLGLAAGWEHLDVKTYFHKPTYSLSELAQQVDELLLQPVAS